MHGGVSLVLAETVASAGSYLFIDRERQKAVGLEINGNHIRSVSAGVVRAEGFRCMWGAALWSGIFAFMTRRIGWSAFRAVRYAIVDTTRIISIASFVLAMMRRDDVMVKKD